MKQSTGPLNHHLCPWCQKPNDFTEIQKDLAGAAGFGGSSVGDAIMDDPDLRHVIGAGINVNDEVSCEHCNRRSTVTGMFHYPVVGISPRVDLPLKKTPFKRFFAHNVQCPHCQQHSDFTEVHAQMGNELVGSQADCDHCGQPSRIVVVERIPYMRLAPKV